MIDHNLSEKANVDYNKTVQQSITPMALFVSIWLTVLGLLGSVGSAFVVLVIFFSKSLRSACFELVAAAACGAFLSAIYFLSRGINQIGILLGVFNLYRISWLCILPAGLLGLWGPPFQCLISCGIACDRMISLLSPVRYRQLNKKYVISVVLFCAAFVTAEDIIGCGVSKLDKLVACNEFTDALQPTFKLTFAGLALGYFVVTVLLYLILLLCFRLHSKSSHHADNEVEAVLFRQQQAAVMPAINLMMVLYLFTGVLGETMINLARHMDSYQWAPTVKGTGSILKATGCFVEIFALMLRSSKFRNCSRSFLGFKPRAVAASVAV